MKRERARGAEHGWEHIHMRCCQCKFSRRLLHAGILLAQPAKLTSLPSSLRPDHPQRDANWQVPMRTADRSWSLWEQTYATLSLPWPWPLPDDLRIRTWPVSPGNIPDAQKWTFCTSRLSKVIVWHIQGGSKKVSCWHSTTAYFFWATLYTYMQTNRQTDRHK